MPVTRCTEEQARKWLAQWAEAGFSASGASRTFGASDRQWRRRIKLAKELCPDSGLVPTDVPEGMKFTKTTVQYDGNGNVIQEWRRLSKGLETLEQIIQAMESRIEGKAPRLPVFTKPCADDLMLEVPFCDVHFGKLGWKPEVGADYDSDIAYKLVSGGMAKTMSLVPDLGLTIITINGDFFHSDTRHNRTEASGHALDVDTRHHKVWDKAMAALQHAAEVAAKKSKRVKFVVIPGNHDPQSAFHLQRLLHAWYRKDPRVEVDDSPTYRKYHLHGICLIGWDHGDKIKEKDLPSLMAMERKEWWAQSIERVWHRGHLHKDKGIMLRSTDGVHSVQCEHLESLAGTDAWHAENGYVGMPQRMCSFLWSAKHGLRSRIYCNSREILETANG